MTDAEDTFVVPASWTDRYPRRSAPLPVELPAGPSAVEVFAALDESSRNGVDNVLRHPEGDPAVGTAGLEYLDDPAAGTPLGAAAACCALFDMPGRQPGDVAVLAADWLRRRGPAFAAAATAELAALIGDRANSFGYKKGTEPLRARPVAGDWQPNRDVLMFLVGGPVRASLAAAGPVEYGAAVQALAGYRDRELPVRAATSFLFPDEAGWVAADCALLATVPDAEFAAYLLYSSVTTGEQVALVDGRLKRTAPTRTMLASLTAGAGTAAVPALARWFTGGDATHLGLPGLLAALPSDQAFALLLARAGEPAVRPVLREAAARFPVRATRLMAAKPNGLFRLHVVRNPAPAKQALAKLSGAAADRVRALLAGPAGRTEAPAKRVPPILQSPPWTVKRRAVKPVVVDGLAAPEGTTVEWAPGEREEWELGWAPGNPKRDWNALVGRLDRGEVADGYVQIGFFVNGPDELAKPRLAAWRPVELWNSREWLRKVVVRHGADATPVMVDAARRRPTEAAGALDPLAGPEVVLLMADWLARLKSQKATASAWLRRHPATAARTLVPPALGKAGTARRQAEYTLRHLAGAGFEGEVRAAAAEYGRAAVGGIDAMLAADPLDTLPTRIPVAPEWAEPALLEPVGLRGGGGVLPAGAVRHLITVLQLSTMDEPYAGLALVRAACEPADLARFAWSLFEMWGEFGYPAAGGWALHAVGLLGDDHAVRRLAPLIRAWPGESAARRAVTGLDVLATIGSEVSLLTLSTIAERVKFKGLREQANARIERIAAELELTAEQLADRLVPAFGLDEHGSTVLDYGPRRFTVGFDEALRPYVVDQDGRPLKALPRPSSTEDGAPYERFVTLKKDVRTIAADQIRRLERAMVDRRRWSAAEFGRHLAGHPLLRYIAGRLVWAQYTVDGAVAGAFRIAEDRTYADAADDGVGVPDDALVGIAHPLDLADLAAWSEVFADYQILQPFPQLGRETFVLTDDERAAEQLTRFDGSKVPVGAVFGLAHRGWRRPAPGDGGLQGWIERPAGEHTVVVPLDPGIVAGYADEYPEQQFGALTVRPADAPEPWAASALPLGTVDPRTMSEVLRDLVRLT